MEIKSNGFFNNRHIGLDYNEDVEILKERGNLIINFIADSYDFDINDLKCLDYVINTDEIVYNIYINYDYTNKKYYVVISIYDFENEIYRDLKEIRIEINTETEFHKIEKVCFDYMKSNNVKKINSYNDLIEEYRKYAI